MAGHLSRAGHLIDTISTPINMNASTTTKRSPPPPPRPVITSLTSTTSTANKGAGKTTSLAEALATSVADYVCDTTNRRKNINGGSPAKSPSSNKSSTTIQTSKQLKQSRIVSAEHNNSPSTNNTTTTNTAQQHEHHAPSSTQGSTPHQPQPQPQPQQQLTPPPRTISTSCSSMSSAVADLASGMFNFTAAKAPLQRTNSNDGSASKSSAKKHPPSSSTTASSQPPPQHGASSTSSSTNNNNNNSAPIISGTAAAVLALQSVDMSPAIVSNPSSVETGGMAGGCVPDPLALNPHNSTSSLLLSRGVVVGGSSSIVNVGGIVTTSSILGGGGTATTGTMGVHSPTDTQGSHSPSMHNNSRPSPSPSSSLSQYPTRYSDGAPIIAGTAAAQMEAIATATAARITSIMSTNNNNEGGGVGGGVHDDDNDTIMSNSVYYGGSTCEDHVVNAVASLGQPPLGVTSTFETEGGGGGGTSTSGTITTTAGGGGGESRAHGFASAMAMGWGVQAPPPPPAMMSKQRGTSSKALSWVDYNNQSQPIGTRVTPDDDNGHGHVVVHEGSSLQSSSRQVALVSASASSRHALQHNNSNSNSNMMMMKSTQVGRQTTSTRSTIVGSGQQSGGGMDILAEIICHAPPMSIVPSSTTTTTARATSFTSLYPPHSHHSHHPTTTAAATTCSSILPSYQESYHQQQSSSLHYQVQAHQAQHNIAQAAPNNGQQQQDTTTTPTARKRAASIPSYQEIYQEMGWSPSHSHQQQQQQLQQYHHQSQHYSNSSSSNGTNAAGAAAGYTYSVEEVQVDHQIPASHDSGGGYNNTHGNSCSGEGSAAHQNQQQRTTMSSHHYNNSREQQQRPPTTHFGHIINRDDIEEGKELYTRKDLGVLGGHLGEHKDVHGNMREGCDSLCLMHLERDIREADGLVWFLYSTDRTNGGGALCQSYHKKRPIRVFRPSLLGGKYAPPFLDIEEDDDDNDVAYRYDGLYMVCAVWDVDGHETEAFPIVGQNGWQTFFFTRVPKKPLDKSKVEAGVEYNAMGTQELWGSIQKMRGVRRPKKFEIPPPPVKLPPVKRAAISGVYKDRKCPGYKRPEPVAPLKPLPPPPPPKSQPRSKSPRNVPNQDYGESDSSSESEEEERHTQSRHVAADEGDDSSDSDSDSSHKQIKHTSSTLSAGSPSKVHTPRPRLNSIAQPKKPSPAANPDDDSSDSEASLPASPAPARQTKRVRKPSPKKKQLLNAMDVSAFFPKRASAAKAEAANRDMLGSQRTYNKRKASATAAAPKKPSRVSGRKKSKLQYSDSEDDSSSEEEKRDPNAIDQSILTVGSRVLVEYKGQVFKSTIRKRRFKNESHDFLIHYDGNKRTNVHWITLDRIKQILEINVDTPPKPKKKPVPPPKNNIKKGGAGNNNKRKAKEQLLRQESLQKSHYMEAKDAGAIGGASDPQSGDSDIKKVSSVESKEPSEEATPSAAKEMPEMENAKEPDNLSVSQAQSESLSSANGVIELKDSDEKKHDDEKPPSKTDVDADMDGNKEIAPVDTQEAAKALEPSSKEKASAAEEELDTEDVEDLASATTNDRPKPTSRNIKTTTAEAASTKKPRETVVTDVNVAGKSKSSENQEPIKDPLQMLAEEAGSDIDDNGSRKESDENSISSIGGSAKQEQSAIAPTSELKYPIGSNVYVEYRHIFYSSTILKTRRKRSAIEYLVHYEGYKKSSNRWVKVNALHDVNVATTQHYEEQRLIPADILYEAEQPDFSMTTRRKKTLDTSEPIASSTASSIPSSTAQRKPPPRRMKSDASETTTQAALENLRAGVDFLPGSMVFVDWNAKLYLAKMLKKRYSGEQMEYRVSYDGFKSNHDAWVSIYKIYEVNPQSKRVFKRINSDLIGGEDKDKPKRRAPPGPRRRESRKKPQDYDEIVSHSSASSTPITRNGDNSAHSRASSRVQTSRTTSTIDMNGIDPGVEFLPGSQLFAEYDGSLCLAKMMKKRGKGDYMEYLIQYTGLKKAKEAWVSTALVYEINPQTKRMFRKLAKK